MTNINNIIEQGTIPMNVADICKVIETPEFQEQATLQFVELADGRELNISPGHLLQLVRALQARDLMIGGLLEGLSDD